ncbi:phospholipase A1-Ibeta2 [Forsythia ovata]|uniref:Phospholipase A1-Ibeta2 n=1 Tax=Forsythia ovata TaxID=205694 RepID=A0ABD1RNM8_9LAMI
MFTQYATGSLSSLWRSSSWQPRFCKSSKREKRERSYELLIHKTIITRVPGMFVSEELDKQLRGSGASSVLNMLDNSMPWAYAHVGTELRVDTKMSPFLKPNADCSMLP